MQNSRGKEGSFRATRNQLKNEVAGLPSLTITIDEGSARNAYFPEPSFEETDSSMGSSVLEDRGREESNETQQKPGIILSSPGGDMVRQTAAFRMKTESRSHTTNKSIIEKERGEEWEGHPQSIGHGPGKLGLG